MTNLLEFKQIDVMGSELCAGPQTTYDRFREVIYSMLVAQEWEVTGIDVSSWQGVMNWEIARPLISFAYLRAGSGNDVADVQYARNRAECIRLGIPYGLYWYVKPDKSWSTTAASIVAAANAANAPLPYVIDVETTGGLGKSALESWLYKLISFCISNTGSEPMIYTSAGFWNAAMPLTTWAKNLRLWIAHWTSASQPIIPNEWGAIANPRPWTFWQYSADGNGQGARYGAQSNSIDLNRYHWGTADFAGEFGVTPPPPEPEPDPPPAGVLQFRVLQDGLRVRTGPGTTFPQVDTLLVGEIVPCLNADGADSWAEIAPGRWANIRSGEDRNMEKV